MSEASGSAGPEERAARVRKAALETGFDLAGIASVAPPPRLGFFADWVARGYAAGMSYLSAQVERRSDARIAFPWARSLVCVALQYDTPLPYSIDAPRDRGWISRYAWGDDYHDLLKGMLERLATRLEGDLGAFRWRAYVDTGPIVERAYAEAAGLGWVGKNTCLIHPMHGSWLFLGELITDLDLAPGTLHGEHCGRCTACLDACPTGAIVAPGVLDARRCISTLTIEERGSISEEWRAPLGRHVFGCDICQDVCPWNRKRRHRGPAALAPRAGLFAPSLEDLAALDTGAFRARLRGSPLVRAKRRGLLRNVAVALGNTPAPGREPALRRLLEDEEPLVREHARWGLGVLERRPDDD